MKRRWWLMLLVVIAPVLHVHAQDGPFRTSGEGKAFYAFVNTEALAVRSLALDWVLVDGDPLARTLVEELQGVWSEAHPVVASFGPDDVCATVVGMGGTAKIDGGGGLGRLVDPFDADDDVLDVAWLASVVGLPVPTIVIVDEFELDGLGRAVRDGATFEPYVLAEVMADGAVLRSGSAHRAGATAEPYEIEVVHGHLILHHVLSILVAKGFDVEGVILGSAGEPSMTLALAAGAEPVLVHLYDIEFAGLFGLEEALDGISELQGASNGHPPLAVVISWGLTGCGLDAAYTDAGDQGSITARNGTEIQTFIEYLYDAIVRLGDGSAVVEEVCTGLQAITGPDGGVDCKASEEQAMVATIVALARFERLAESAFGLRMPDDPPVNTVFFAAAGNESFPVAMPPASFGSVLAVAACTPTSAYTSDRAWFSNVGDEHHAYGEAVAPGGWFAAPSVAGVMRETDGAMPDLGYWGTSFAAPLAALASWRRPQVSGGEVDGSELLWPHADDLCGPFARPPRNDP